MAATGLAGMRPYGSDGHEVILDCDDNGLDKPLLECNNKQIGAYGEDLAALYLESQGFVIRERNWRSSFGEVDILAEADGTLVLVEVKTRIADPQDTQLAPELSVNFRKQKRYQKLALVCLAMQSRFDSVRFDVVAVKLTGETSAVLRHYPSAFVWDE